MYNECINKCEGIPLSSNCIVWEGKKYDFASFDTMFEFVMDTAKDYMTSPVVDLKTLSTLSLTRDQILQLFVDKILQLQIAVKNNNVNPLSNCNLDISTINNCGSCAQSLCEKIQILIGVVASQQVEINQLKETLYN